MEAKETAGLLMTEREAGDCSSGLLETTSNRPWSAAKENTQQLLQKKKKKEEKRSDGGGRGRRVRMEKREKLLQQSRNVCSRIKEVFWLSD